MPTLIQTMNMVRNAAAILAALRAIKAHDDKLCDAAMNGREAVAPDGDDYNVIFDHAAKALALVEG